jgi:hypothetical protein
VIVLGLALVVLARNERQSEDQGGVPQLGDHIHLAVGTNACGSFLPDVPEFESPIGIHTHGDGVIHIHPFSQLGVGANATFGRFLADARESEDAPQDVSISDSKLVWLGDTVKEGTTECKGVDDPVLRVAYWPDVETTDKDPVITTGDFTDIKLNETGGGITVFYGDKKADIPKPPSGANLKELGAVDSGNATATTADPTAGSSSSTTPTSVATSLSTTAPR